jgi:hypothetical protein
MATKAQSEFSSMSLIRFCHRSRFSLRSVSVSADGSAQFVQTLRIRGATNGIDLL